MIQPLDTILMLLVVGCAMAIIIVKELMTAVIVFSVFSFFSALFFALLGALDVAFTEAVVGAAVTTVFFVAAIAQADRRRSG